MGVEGLIEETESWTCEPLSGRPLDEIVKDAENAGDLVTYIRQPEVSLDFKLKFIAVHEEFFSVQLPDRQSRIRTCHNLGDKGIQNEIVFVFVPGLGGNLEQFEPLLKLLDSEQKAFLAFDSPGFGQSSEWEDYPMLKVVELIFVLVCDVFKKWPTGGSSDDDTNPFNGRKIILVGHSMGCFLACHLYEQHLAILSVVEKFVLLTPPKAHIEQLSKNRRLFQWALYGIFKLPWLFDIYRNKFDQVKGLESSGIKQYFYQDNDDVKLKYRKLWQFKNNISNKSRTILGYLLGWVTVDWDKFSVMLTQSDIKQDIILFGAAKDPVAPIKNFKYYEDTINKEYLRKVIILPDCSHNLCLDRPELVCKMFLQEVINEVDS
ncbi:triacylglycerol lipase [Saccharomyces eubayanus]|uniref:triacylglycerol lipase n=1 Tax=Saccharomyces eubayanus TaxID=1080349 RepID=UPI0006C1F017|nr:LDH1-like protein [Saccharomyces eubayanus]KOH00519.1 LDH1-like protein [Saccharomyces eubayanus]